MCIQLNMSSFHVSCGITQVVPGNIGSNMPISVYRLGEMPIQSCGQGVSAQRGKAGAWLNAHTELWAKRQRSAREVIYRNRPIEAARNIWQGPEQRRRRWRRRWRGRKKSTRFQDGDSGCE